MVDKAEERLQRTKIRSTLFVLAGCAGPVLALLMGVVSIQRLMSVVLALLALIMTTTLSLQRKWQVVFFLNGLLLTAGPRFISGIDLIVGISLAVLVLILAHMSIENQKKPLGSSGEARPAYLGPVALPLASMLVLMLFTTLKVDQGVRALIPWVIGISIALVICLVPGHRLPGFRGMLQSLLLASLVTCLYDLQAAARGVGFNAGEVNSGRFSGSLGDYELMAEYYGASILVGVGILILEKKRRWRLIAFATLAAALYLLILTQSRGPLVLVIVLVPVAAMGVAAISNSRGLRRRVVVFSCIALLASFIGYGSFSTTPLYARLIETPFQGNLSATLNREAVWSNFTSLNSYLNSGVLGNGYEYPYELIGSYPHSLYFWLYWSGGFAALICFGIICLALAGALVHKISCGSTNAVLAAVILLFLMVDQLKIEVARMDASICFLWIVISLGIIAVREEKIYEEQR